MPQATSVTIGTAQEATVGIRAHMARTVGVVLTMAAVVTLSACQDTTVVSNASQSVTVTRRIPGTPPPVAPIGVVFSNFTIAATETGCRVGWMTDTPISSIWKWREVGEFWNEYAGPFYPLKTSHYANMTGTFEIGVGYEFMASGYDIDGVLHEDSVHGFQVYAPGDVFQFPED